MREATGDTEIIESCGNNKEVKLKKVKISESLLKDDECGAYTPVVSNREAVIS